MLRSPGYVLFLALIFSVFGKSLVAVQFVNLALSSITAVLTYRLGRLLNLSGVAALVAAGITIFHPGVLIAESRGGLECLLMLCLVSLALLTIMAMRRFEWRDFSLLGLLNGVTMLIKSSVAPVLPVLFIYCLWNSPIGARRKKLVAGMAVSGLITMLVMSPWVARNYLVSSEFIPTMTVSGLVLFQGAYIIKHLDLKLEHFEILTQAANEQLVIARELGLQTKKGYFPQFFEVKDEVLYYRELGNRALADYSQEPGLLYRGIVHNVWSFWIGGRTERATLLNGLLTLPFLVLAGVGFLLARKHALMVSPIMLIIVSFMIPHLFILAVARYYIRLVPFVALLVAIPLTLWAGRMVTATVEDNPVG